jgi:hypothetical protein
MAKVKPKWEKMEKERKGNLSGEELFKEKGDEAYKVRSRFIHSVIHSVIHSCIDSHCQIFVRETKFNPVYNYNHYCRLPTLKKL